MGLFRKIFGSYSDRQIKKLRRIADEIEALADKYAAMSNEELADVTNVLKARLAAGETLALGDPTDTLIAAYVKTELSDIATYLKKECKEPGMFQHGGTAELIYNRDLLCFDFVVERSYESEAAYNAFVADRKAAEDAFNAKVAALKAAGYQGKKLSVVGDSISTFNGVMI